MPIHEIALRIVLALGGAFIVFTGLDFAVGGIASLGFEGPRDFFTVTDQHAFDVRDNHTRFIGAVWMSVGLVFLASALWLSEFKPALLMCVVFIFIGGVARLTAFRFDLVTGPEILPSFILEMVGMPLLYWWVRSTKARS